VRRAVAFFSRKIAALGWVCFRFRSREWDDMLVLLSEVIIAIGAHTERRAWRTAFLQIS
jgi:hypothetical protein